MGGGDQIQPADVAVRIERRDPAAIQPELKIGSAVTGVKHHLVVVAQERNKLASVGECNQLIEDSTTIVASINHVTERDDHIVRLQIDGPQKRLKSNCASVDVGDCNRAGCHS
jgi:hypothetical protein